MTLMKEVKQDRTKDAVSQLRLGERVSLESPFEDFDTVGIPVWKVNYSIIGEWQWERPRHLKVVFSRLRGFNQLMSEVNKNGSGVKEERRDNPGHNDWVT